MARYGFVIDLKRCYGCYSCQVTCKATNHTPQGIDWAWCRTSETGRFPMATRQMIPLVCQQCADPHCMTVCPISYCKTCLFRGPVFDHDPIQYMQWAESKGALRLPSDTMLFHLTRMNHMALSCVGCGACTSACPADLPVASVFGAVGESVQAAFAYVPGRDMDEKLPLITFQENEWLEVGK